ncbi:hypothetical protein [Chakrabartyella piscis]|uniref:hypothetical protein n=1 Tax=Chakrabartyella piscis TaxID=2918914 RepID=UPI00295840D7|nr:hypothetical protein [Chakrabartyella piscis]
MDELTAKQKEHRRKHEYEKRYYDRITTFMPKGSMQLVDSLASARGFKSRSRYVRYLLEQDLIKARNEGKLNENS